MASSDRQRRAVVAPSGSDPHGRLPLREPHRYHRETPYEYLSYYFANKSKDIVDLFLGACDQVGIRDYRITYDKPRDLSQVRINRRASVALMLEHVGLKE